MESILKNSFQLARHGGILNASKSMSVCRNTCWCCGVTPKKLLYSADCKEEDPNCKTVENVCRSYDRTKRRDDDSLEKPCCVLRTDTDPCKPVPRKSQPKPEKEPFFSMWEPPCTPDEEPFCKDMLPRFDAIYYKPSDRRSKCQRTWVECPQVKERIKKLCCMEDIQPPEVIKRVKPVCPTLACTFDYARMRHVCMDHPETKCKKVQMPCCPPVRCNKSCERESRVAKCTRLRTPFPCYSDKLPRPKAVGLCECGGLETGCEIIRAKKRYNIS